MGNVEGALQLVMVVMDEINDYGREVKTVCTDSITAISAESGIGGTSSNSDRLYFVHFTLISCEKCMDLFTSGSDLNSKVE